MLRVREIGLVSQRPPPEFCPMPQDPNLAFDETVLGMIERSPSGSLPSTPTYQDALKRLYAAHKVYASADHKGGHVTARSLAAAPSFFAANLDAFRAGGIDADALESNNAIFDRYLASLPAGLRTAAASHRLHVAGKPAHHRAKHRDDGAVVVARDPIHTLFLVPGVGRNPGLPGNYLYGSVLQLSAAADAKWAVHLHDSDDGAAFFDGVTITEAFEKLDEVVVSAPFTMDELVALGFRLN